MISLLSLLNGKSPITILDIGAAYHKAPSYQCLIDYGVAKLIGFEPDKEACVELEGRYRSPHRFFPMFIGDGAPATFYRTNCRSTSSLFKPNTRLLSRFSGLAEVVTQVSENMVSTERLDGLDEIDDVDFIKIDVQGGEISIFKSARNAISSAVLIQVEVNFIELYEGRPLFAEVDQFLRANGFVFHCFTEMAHVAFNSGGESLAAIEARQCAWSDAFYVRDWMRLEELSEEKLVRMSVLINDIARSHDLALVVLQAADRKSGGHRASQFLSMLKGGSTLQKRESAAASGAPWYLQTSYGVEICTPPTLDSITTYVLLEQEKWFEKELDFVLSSLEEGMCVIDIGANRGVYSLPIAKHIGLSGHVYAFEPGTDNRKGLEDGALRNHLTNVVISEYALADSEKDGWLHFAVSGELNALKMPKEGDAGESVSISTLDRQAKLYGWMNIGFVKMDAEGQEARILAGGREFFNEHSPLVMFEIHHGDVIDDSIRWMFQLLGYHTYRLLGDGTCLVPVTSDELLDSYQLNLFAAKNDRAQWLAEKGLLATNTLAWSLSDSERILALARLTEQQFAKGFDFCSEDVLESPFADAMVDYSAVIYLSLSVERRVSAIRSAYEKLASFVVRHSSPAALSTFARVAAAYGKQSDCVEALHKLITVDNVVIDAPFFPASPSFDSILPEEGRESDWFMLSATEQLCLSKAYSSHFVANDFDAFKALLERPECSPEIVRRILLAGIRAGKPVGDVARHLRGRLQTLNRSTWMEVLRLAGADPHDIFLTEN